MTVLFVKRIIFWKCGIWCMEGAKNDDMDMQGDVISDECLGLESLVGLEKAGGLGQSRLGAVFDLFSGLPFSQYTHWAGYIWRAVVIIYRSQ